MTRITPAARRNRRSAFTLIELLVVIAIIALLLSISAAVLVGVFGSQNKANTGRTVQKISSELNRQWDAARKQALDEVTNGTALTALQAQFPASPTAPQQALQQKLQGNADLVRQIWVNLRLAQEFPMSFGEARSGSSLTVSDSSGNSIITFTRPAKNSYFAALKGQAGGSPPTLESSACLYLALSESRRGAVANPDDAVGVSSIRTVNGSKCFIDLWRTPIGYLRFSQAPTTPPPQGLAPIPSWTPVVFSAGADTVPVTSQASLPANNTGDDIISTKLPKGG